LRGVPVARFGSSEISAVGGQQAELELGGPERGLELERAAATCCRSLGLG
jgi:hypothetical protein